MKNVIRLTIFFAVTLGLVSSCGEPEKVEPEKLNAPAGLTVGTVTQTTAALSWTTVEGAEKYNVSIGEAMSVEITGTTYEADGLTAATEYSWKVQAVKGDLTSDWTEGPGFMTLDEPGTDTVPAPTNLQFTDLTPIGVTLTWNHADADTHEVVIGDAAAVSVENELTYQATGLTPETPYTWKVRSGKGGLWSEWADGEGFTTPAAPDAIEIDFPYTLYPYYGPGWAVSENCFSIGFSSYDFFAGNYEGWKMNLYIIPGEIDASPTTQFISIPTGTYTFTNSLAVNTLYYQYEPVYENFTSIYQTTADGYQVDPPTARIASGEVTVTGDYSNYTLTGNFILKDGTPFTGTFKGAIPVANIYYNPSIAGFKKASFIEFGMTEEGLRHYYLSLEDENYADTGTGSILLMSLYSSGTSDSIIPDGTYRLGTAGDFRAQESFTLISSFINGAPNTTDTIISGQVGITRTGEGTYDIAVDFVTRSGVALETTYSGPVTSTAPPTE